jgi:hypothetical protein
MSESSFMSSGNLLSEIYSMLDFKPSSAEFTFVVL